MVAAAEAVATVAAASAASSPVWSGNVIGGAEVVWGRVGAEAGRGEERGPTPSRKWSMRTATELVRIGRGTSVCE